MDVMNYVVLRKTGFPKGRVVGMGGILDLSRFKSTISAMLDVSHSSITSLVIGEHGESMLPLARFTSIGGVPLTKLMDETQIAQAMEATRRIAIDVISKKGATVDAPANGVVRMVKAIAWDRKEVIPASAYLEGEYGVSGLCIGVPLVLGGTGWRRYFPSTSTRRRRPSSRRAPRRYGKASPRSKPPSSSDRRRRNAEAKFIRGLTKIDE